MSDSASTDREGLRHGAAAFIESDRFDRHVAKLYMQRRPRWPLSLFRKAVPGLDRSQCRDLVKRGRIVRAFVVMDSGIMSGGPMYCGPALVTASLLGTDEGDRAAGEAQGKVTDLWLDDVPAGTEPELEAMLADDEYHPYRKRLLPRAFGGESQVHFLDVEIDNELASNRNPFLSPKFFYLDDPAPEGIVLQIPS